MLTELLPFVNLGGTVVVALAFIALLALLLRYQSRRDDRLAPSLDNLADAIRASGCVHRRPAPDLTPPNGHPLTVTEVTHP